MGSALGNYELMAIEGPDEEEGAQVEARGFLEGLLSEGPVLTREIRAAANANGHKWRTVERAKAALGITATKGALYVSINGGSPGNGQVIRISLG